MRILTTEPLSSINEEFRETLLEFTNNDKIHEVIDTISILNIDGLHYLPDWTPILNSIDQFLETTIQDNRDNLFQRTISATDCEEGSGFEEKLLKVLRFTSSLLRLSFAKEIYNSLEHILVLTSAVNQDIACEAVNCIYSLASFPDIHHSVIMEDRHMTALQKNQPYYWQLFQILECIFPFVPRPSNLFVEDTAVSPCSLPINFEVPGGMSFSQSALALAFPDEKLNERSDSLNVSVSGESIQADFSSVSSEMDSRFTALWTLRGIYWSSTKAGKMRLMTIAYQLCYIIFTSYPDYTAVGSFFVDKVQLLKDFVEHIASVTYDCQSQDPEMLELRILACFCIASLLDTKDQSSSPLGMQYPWLFQELGVNRGQFMGLMPSLLRSCCLSLSSIRSSITKRFDGNVMSNSDLFLGELHAYRWGERLIILVYYLCNLNNSLPAFLENGLISLMLGLVNKSEEAMFPFQMWIDNMALTILESVMTPNTSVHTAFRDFDGPDIVLRRMRSALTAFVTASKGKSLPPSQTLLIQQFISLISCYMQESRADGDDGQTSLLYRNSNLNAALHLIFDNASQMHPSVLSASTALMAEIMNRDLSPPSIVNWMVQQDLPRKAFLTLEQRPSIANCDLPLAIIGLASAISLTAEGIKIVQESKALQLTLEYLGDTQNFLPYSTNLMTDQASSLGATLEELLRHYPVFVEPVLQTLIGVVGSIHERAENIRKNNANSFFFEDNSYNYNPAYSALMHSGVACACCLEPILSRNLSATTFMQMNGFQALMKLKDVSLGTAHQFLVGASCALEGSSTSLGYSVLVATVTRCVFQLVDSSPSVLLLTLINSMTDVMDTLESTLECYRTRYCLNESRNSLFYGFIDTISAKPFHLIEKSHGSESQILAFAHCLMCLANLDFLYEVFGSLQGGRHSRHVNPGDLLIEEVKSKFSVVFNRGMQSIYVPSQEEMSRYRTKKRISGLSTAAVTEQPVFLLMITSDFAIFRQTIEDNSKRTGKMLRGTFVEAMERKCGSNGLVRYRTKYGWVGQTKGSTMLEPQVMIVDIRENKINEKRSEQANKVSSRSVQSQYDVDKYSNVSLRRAALFSFFSHHINTRNSVIGTFLRVFGAKDPSSSLLATSKLQTKEFLSFYFPTVRSTLMALLPPLSKQYPEFNIETFLSGLTEDSINIESSSNPWISTFSFPMPEVGLDKFDLDTILTVSRSMELFRTLLFESKKSKAPSPFMISMLTHLIKTSTYIDDLLMATSLILQAAMTLSPTPFNCLNNSTPGESQLILERKLMALSTLDLAIDLWKQLLVSFVMPSDVYGFKELSSRLILSMIRAFYPVWNNENFHFLPASIARGVLEMIGHLVKGITDLSVESARKLESEMRIRRTERRAPARPARFQPDPTAVQTCIDMGFDEQSVLRAMRALRSSDVSLVVPYIVETPFGEMMADDTGEMNEDEVVERESTDAPTQLVVPSLVPRDVSSNTEELKPLHFEKQVAGALQPGLYSLTRMFMIRMIKSGAIPADWALDSDLLSSASHTERSVFTVSILNCTIKAIENFSWTETSIKLLLIRWIAAETIKILSSKIDAAGANALYGLLHSISVLMSCRIVNSQHFRQLPATPEYFILTLNFDPQFSKFQSSLVNQLRSFYCGDDKVSGNDKWITPALMVLGNLNQPVLCNMSIDIFVSDLEHIMEYNSGKVSALNALLCTPDRLVCAEVKRKTEEYKASTANRSLPLLESSLTTEEKKHAAEFALKVLSWLDGEHTDADVSEEKKQFIGNTARASLQLLVHLLADSSVRDFCQQEKMLSTIFSLKVSFDGMHQIVFSVLQRYMEADSYLKPTMKVILKLIFDRLTMKSETSLSLKTFTDVASPLLYRNQSMFLEELQEAFTLENRVGNSIVLKPKKDTHTSEVPQASSSVVVTPSTTSKNPRSSINEESADMHVAKRMRTERTFLATKVEDSTPLKRRTESHGSSFSRGALLVEYVVSELVSKWANIMDIANNTSSKAKSRSLFSISELFLILADLVASFPSVVTCIQRSRIREEHLGEHANSLMTNSSNEFNFLSFVLKQILLGSFFETLNSKELKAKYNAEETLESCFYFLAAVVSRPGEGRMSLFSHIKSHLQTLATAPQSMSIIRISDLLMSFLQPPSKWASRELFILPAKDITTALLACNIDTELIALFNALSLWPNLDEKSLQAVAILVDILIKRAIPAVEVSLDNRRSHDSQCSGFLAQTIEATGGNNLRRMNTNSSENQAAISVFSADIAPGTSRERETNALQEFHEQLLFPTEPQMAMNGVELDDDNDSQNRSETRQRRIHDIEQFFEEEDRDDDNHHHLVDDDDDDDDDDDIDMDDDDDHDPDDHVAMGGHHHHHHEDVIMDDDEDEEDDRSEGTNPSRRSDASSMHRSENEDDHAGDEEEMEMINDDEDDGDHMEMEDILNGDDHEVVLDDDDHDSDDMDDDEDDTAEDMIEGHEDHDHHESDEDDYDEDEDGDEQFEVELEDENDPQENSEGDDQPQEESFVNNVGGPGGEGLDEQEQDPDVITHHMPRFGRRTTTTDELDEDETDNPWDEMETAMQRFDDMDGLGMIRQQRSRHRGQHNRASAGMQLSMVPPLPRGHSASVHIRLGHMDESSNAVEFSEAMPISDFQELFSGILPEQLLQGRGATLAREPNVEIDISRMMQNHHSHSHHQQLSTASQLRPHPLMEAVDSRRSRPANNLSGSSSISLAFGMMLGQGNLTRDVPFLSYESQMKQQRSHMPPRRKTLGPLVSDRRWGTDLNDLDLPCARPTELHSAVERYLLDKVFGVTDSSNSSSRARLLRSSNALPTLLRMHRRENMSGLNTDNNIASGSVPRLQFGGANFSLSSLTTAPTAVSGLPAFFDFSRLMSLAGARMEETKEEEGEPLIESKEDDQPAAPVAPVTSAANSSSSSSPTNPTVSSSNISEPLAADTTTAYQQPSALVNNNNQMNVSSDSDIDEDDERAVEDADEEHEGVEVEEMDTSDAGEDSGEEEDEEDGHDVMDDDNDDESGEDHDEPDPFATDNENLHFLNSVPPDLRTEILLTAEQGFLNTLPLAVQDEARAIRESRAMQYQMFNYAHQEQSAAPASTSAAVADAPVSATAMATAIAAPVELPPLDSEPTVQTSVAATTTATTNNEVAAHPESASAPTNNSLATVSRSITVPVTHSSSPVVTASASTSAPANTSTWFMPWVGNVSCKELSFDNTLVVSVMQWIMRSKNDKLAGKFRLLATMTTFEVCRNEILRIVLGMMLLREDIVYDSIISMSTKIAAGNSLTENDRQHLSLICANICKELSKDTDSYRRLLNALVQVIKRTGYLAILELFENNSQNSKSITTNLSVFQMLLQCLHRPNLSIVDIDRTLQVIERACKHFAKLSTEQANQLVQVQQQSSSSNGDEASSSVLSQSNIAAASATSGAEPPQQQPSVSAHLPASNSMTSLPSVANSRHTVIPATMQMYGLNNHSHSHKQDKPKRRITYPELTAPEIAILVDCYIASDCGGISKKIFHKIFRYLSLTDGNWRRFLSSLADHASELVSLSTVQFEHLNQALDEALQKQEDIITVMCRPEFAGPSRSMTPGTKEPFSQVLQESKLLGALKLMTMLRSRSTPAAATEARVIASYLRGIPTSDLWELLCVCLDKVAAIEELELVRDARRRGRARTFSVGSPSASGTALDSISTPATRSAPPSSSSSTGNKPISTLTMRFVPLIEFFLSTFSRTLITTPAVSVPATTTSTSSHGVELVRMNSNALVPGSRFRQSTAFLSTQLEIEEDSAAGKLVRFSEQHQELLNSVLRSNIHLLETTFSPLVNVTKLRALLHFDIKRAFFKSKMKKLRSTSARSFGGSLRITVRRQHIFEDSFQSLRYKSADEMRRRLVVSFHNEEGVDAGGLTREWYNVLAREIFNANYALFLSSGDGVTFQPNPHSAVNTDHLFYFKFVGRVFGKAICDGFLLDAHFTRSFYKHMLGLPVTLQDLEAIEPEYYKSLQQLLDTPLEYLGLDLTFSAETNDFGAVTVTDLLPGGRDITVNDDNKHEYVRLLAHHRMTTAIRKQIDAFLEGFHELIPAELISIFDASELELLISGLPEIDLDDMRANTEYAGGYKASDPIVSWFWSALRSFSKEEKALFLQFVTGTSKVPLDGFKALYGSDGLRKFSICKAFGGDSKLPAAHTCFNQLDLPEYTSEEKLREKLLLAIREGSEGFGFA